MVDVVKEEAPPWFKILDGLRKSIKNVSAYMISRLTHMLGVS
jgi:hypothetical protein